MGWKTIVSCLFAGVSESYTAMVESDTVCLGACALWHMGWCFHHLYDKHLWCSSLPSNRMAGGEFALVTGLDRANSAVNAGNLQ